MRDLVRRALRAVFARRRGAGAHGGTIGSRRIGDEVPVLLSPAEHITDPDRAAALGLRLPAGARRHGWADTECLLAEMTGRLNATVDHQRRIGRAI